MTCLPQLSQKDIRLKLNCVLQFITSIFCNYSNTIQHYHFLAEALSIETEKNVLCNGAQMAEMDHWIKKWRNRLDRFAADEANEEPRKQHKRKRRKKTHSESDEEFTLDDDRHHIENPMIVAGWLITCPYFINNIT